MRPGKWQEIKKLVNFIADTNSPMGWDILEYTCAKDLFLQRGARTLLSLRWRSTRALLIDPAAPLSLERWQEIDQISQSSLKLDHPRKRYALLVETCISNLGLRGEIKELLACPITATTNYELVRLTSPPSFPPPGNEDIILLEAEAEAIIKYICLQLLKFIDKENALHGQLRPASILGHSELFKMDFGISSALEGGEGETGIKHVEIEPSSLFEFEKKKGYTMSPIFYSRPEERITFPFDVGADRTPWINNLLREKDDGNVPPEITQPVSTSLDTLDETDINSLRIREFSRAVSHTNNPRKLLLGLRTMEQVEADFQQQIRKYLLEHHGVTPKGKVRLNVIIKEYESVKKGTTYKGYAQAAYDNQSTILYHLTEEEIAAELSRRQEIPAENHLTK